MKRFIIPLTALVVVTWLILDRAAVQSPPSIILISIDTLRPDHLGCYGYHRDTSPSIDALSRDSVLFQQAIAHAPSTLSSHASLFSSLLPQHHSASFDSRSPLPETVLTLAELLRANDYATASFNAGGQISAEFGTDQGFETYDQRTPTFDVAATKATTWIDGRESDPFFLFLHTYEVHHPYHPREDLLELLETEDYSGDLPEAISVELLEEINKKNRPGSKSKIDFTEADLARIITAYDAEIRSMDEGMGKLIRGLKEREIYDDLLILFTSDHGEEFNEHGWVGWHSHTLYDELLKVPLLIKLPRGRAAGTVLDTQVRLIDLAPTVLSVAGIEAPPAFEGISLLPLIEESRQLALPAVSALDRKSGEVASIRYRDWKWLDGRLYNLGLDPREQRDLAKTEPELSERLESLLKEIVTQRSPLATKTIETEQKTEEQLRALGYIN